MDTNTTTKQKKPTRRANAGWAKGQKGTTKKHGNDAGGCALANEGVRHSDRLIGYGFNSNPSSIGGGVSQFWPDGLPVTGAQLLAGDQADCGLLNSHTKANRHRAFARFPLIDRRCGDFQHA